MAGNKTFKDLQNINKQIVRSDTNFISTPSFKHIWHQVVDTNSDEMKKRLIVILNSRGCYHAHKGDGPCFNCGLVTASNQGKIISLPETEQQIQKIIHMYDFSKENITEFDLFNTGSLLDDWQISSDVRKMLFQKISRIKSITDILIDSRPEDVNKKKIMEIKNIIGQKRLWVGIGLETLDDTIRRFCINKSFTLKDFKRAVAVLKSSEANLFVYLLFKPVLLSEYESISDSIETIKYLADLSLKRQVPLRISLEPGVVQGSCLLTSLYKNNLYKTPWLWSVVKVVSESHKFSKGCLRIGIPEEVPLILDRRRNYDEKGQTCNCSSAVEECIMEYNITRSLNAFQSLPKCKCKKRWKSQLAEDKIRSDSPFEKRIKLIVSKLKKNQND